MPYGYVPNSTRAMEAFYAKNAPKMRVNPASIPVQLRSTPPLTSYRPDTNIANILAGQSPNPAGLKSSAPSGSTVTPKAAKPKGKLLKEGGFFDAKSGKLSGIVDDIANPQFDYNTKTGLKGWDKNLGSYWTLGQLALQGYGAARDLQSAGDYRDRSEDLMSDIVAASYNSPTIQYDLAPDQLETLRKLRDGDYETDTDLGDLDLLSILGDVGMGVLGGIPGGIGGMVLGGLGGLGTSLASDYSNAQSRQTAELEALYQAVLESERQHNDLRKQRAYASYGLGGY